MLCPQCFGTVSFRNDGFTLSLACDDEACGYSTPVTTSKRRPARRHHRPRVGA